MKYFVGILVLMISYSAPIFGQSIVAVRGGTNLTNIRGTEVANTVRKSVRMGVSIVIPIRGRFSLQFGGDYVPKGGFSDHFPNLELNIDYIEFSGLGTITIISPRRAPSLYILAGPTVAFKVRNEGEDPLERRYRKYPFEFNTLDFGIAGGIGMQMAFYDGIIGKAELLYTRSIRSINKTSFYAYDLSGGPEVKGIMLNQALFFSIGFGFPYGRRN